MRFLRSRAAKSVALLAFLLVLAEGRTSALDPTPTPQPRLVLALSVDQMRFDYLTRFKPLFYAGLRVLLERGAVFSHAMYRHANTETGPGHSVLLSGRDPSHSGIVANEWWDPLAGRRVNVVEDPVQSTLGGPGRAASPANFLGFTVGDVLKRQSPASRVVGVSLKDRSAVLVAGRRGDGAYWYEVDGGNFITSTYYMKTVPAWLEAWNRRRVPDSYATSTWSRLIADEVLYRQYAGEDAVDGEWDRKDTVFPHATAAGPRPGSSTTTCAARRLRTR